MTYELPKTVEISGKNYDIRSDFRAILDICMALDDPDLNEQEKAIVALGIFYPDFENIPHEQYEEAVKKCFSFIEGGELDKSGQKSPKLIDWDKDFKIIVAPVNRVMGKEVREEKYMHWWTFLSAYYEIGGDCTFAQVVSIRDKLARGKKLDKFERDWYRKNKNIVDIPSKYSGKDNDTLSKWIG